MNGLYKINFSVRLLPILESQRIIPYEIIGGRREQAVHHIALNKTLIADCGNIIKMPIIMISADVINCFDCIAYFFASLTCHHFSLQLEYIIVLFISIQIVKIKIKMCSYLCAKEHS